ncbi:hypothetical protein KAW80_00645 [Candidatus Babeliales bacterium]|nr:hypothetical protein [Candidatus Babeliales bacterium]
MKKRLLVFLLLFFGYLEGSSIQNERLRPLGRVFNSLKYNFHKVSGGALYRSMQLSYRRESEFNFRNNIKISLNLRGEHFEERWWRGQKSAADDLGVVFVNIPVSKRSYPSLYSLSVMLAVIHNPRGILEDPEGFKKDPLKYVFDPNGSTVDEFGKEIPIKVNCQFGADRTGMFCALFIIERELRRGVKPTAILFRKAKRQMSLLYRSPQISNLVMNKFIGDWWRIRRQCSLEEAIRFWCLKMGDKY